MLTRGVPTGRPCLQERESTCARRDMEQLRLEYLAREERFMLDGDRNELRTIKQELDELRYYIQYIVLYHIIHINNTVGSDNHSERCTIWTPVWLRLLHVASLLCLQELCPRKRDRSTSKLVECFF